MKIDPYKHKERYTAWKEKVKDGIPGISKENSDLALAYLRDMEIGVNVAKVSIKGSRSYIRLNSLREKIGFFSKRFEEIYGLKCITEIKEEQLLEFFSKIREGTIKRQDGKEYKSIETAGKTFKAFWHWWIKINRKKGVEIKDITEDLDTRADKPDWVYLTEFDVKKLVDNSIPKYKALILFLFDTGIRSPTELMNVKVSDIYNDCKEVNIRDEISKTFGRKIKLMMCSEFIKEYIKENELKDDDFLFKISPTRTNEYLKRLATRVLGDYKTLAGSKTSELTMYDFRHVSCCYWLPRYKSESALKYRFGWKKSEKVHYYSELLGMKDTIAQEDMMIDTTKTEMERRLDKTEREKELLQDRLRTMEFQLAKIMEVTNRLSLEVANV